MRGRMLIFLLSVGLFFTQCEVPVEPSVTGMDGTWKMTWKYGEEDLLSEMAILDGKAEIRAFGNQQSALLSAYQEATFNVDISSPFLYLVNRDSGVVLSYLIIYQDRDSIILSYLNEIEVHLTRYSD
jgi:hypothetical protein